MSTTPDDLRVPAEDGLLEDMSPEERYALLDRLMGFCRKRHDALLANRDRLQAEVERLDAYVMAEAAGASLPGNPVAAVLTIADERKQQVDRLQAEVAHLREGSAIAQEIDGAKHQHIERVEAENVRLRNTLRSMRDELRTLAMMTLGPARQANVMTFLADKADAALEGTDE